VKAIVQGNQLKYEFLPIESYRQLLPSTRSHFATFLDLKGKPPICNLISTELRVPFDGRNHRNRRKIGSLGGEGRIGSGNSRVVGFVRGGGAPADAAVIEAADLNPIAAVLPIRRAGAGLLVRPRRLVVGGLQRPGQPLYLRAPRDVRPRQSCDSHTNQNTEPFLVSAKSARENKTGAFQVARGIGAAVPMMSSTLVAPRPYRR
jgi:hypothetical protein